MTDELKHKIREGRYAHAFMLLWLGIYEESDWAPCMNCLHLKMASHPDPMRRVRTCEAYEMPEHNSVLWPPDKQGCGLFNAVLPDGFIPLSLQGVLPTDWETADYASLCLWVRTSDHPIRAKVYSYIKDNESKMKLLGAI